jgi:undecaprenyl-diphosphatase
MTPPEKPPTPPAVTDPAHSPPQQLVDTPAAPWQRPKPADKAAAQPVKDALADALNEVHSDADAERVLDEVEAATGNAPAEQVTGHTPAKQDVSAGAAEVAQAGAQPSGHRRAAQVLTQAVRSVETSAGPAREALAEATQETLNPEQQGARPAGEYARQRAALWRALMHRLKPANQLDARIFIAVNHLPHSRVSNGFFYFLTFIFAGGGAWYALMAAAAAARRDWEWKVVRTAVVPLAVSTLIVEYPVKAFFRRRRPFIDIVRAVVVGKKPGTWSFPSGHSASAFAGAWLLRQRYPELTPMFYGLAALVAFSRIYLGDHYPGDVLSGSLAGHFLAQALHWLLGGQRRARRALRGPRVVEHQARRRSH